jgi:hypothetical protein
MICFVKDFLLSSFLWLRTVVAERVVICMLILLRFHLVVVLVRLVLVLVLGDVVVVHVLPDLLHVGPSVARGLALGGFFRHLL